MDEKGQAFSIDLMLAFIIITVIMGISANAMDMASYKMQDYSSRFSLDRITTDAADILIKSPGSPEDWENYPNFDITPGLAKVDIQTGRTMPNTLSFRKISKLTARYKGLINNILPNWTNSSMVIYPTNPSLKPIVIANNTPKPNADVSVANRTILCDYMYLNIVIGMNTHRSHVWPVESGFDLEICTHANLNGDMKHEQPDFKTGKPGWACHHFNITQDDLNSTDFYIITDPNSLTDDKAGWIIDRPENMNYDEQKFGSTPILVNDKITQVLGTDKKAVLWFHVKTGGDPNKSFDAYIVSVPKGTPADQVQLNYLNPQPCFFVLQVWL